MTFNPLSGSSVSPELLEELFRKIGKGEITGPMLNNFNKGRNPYALERNKHGHITFSIFGLYLVGSDEVERLYAAGYQLSEAAQYCLCSHRDDSYDRHHLLRPGHSYHVALMPGREVKSDAERTSEALCQTAIQKFGYSPPVASFVPRVRELLSNHQMEELGIRYATALHKPITDHEGDPSVLAAHNDDGMPRISAYVVSPDKLWDAEGVFIFPYHLL